MNLIYDPFQCISTIAFVKNEGEVLDSPIWIMLINIVALEMLGAKMPKPTGLYWYLDPTYYSQTDVESLVVVAAAASVTQPLATGLSSSSARWKLSSWWCLSLSLLSSLQHHTRPVVEGKFYRLNNYNISRLLLLLWDYDAKILDYKLLVYQPCSCDEKYLAACAKCNIWQFDIVTCYLQDCKYCPGS